MSDLYILGAGFSKAISPAMPVVSELSTQLDRYGTTAVWESEVSKLVRKDFEAGLSYQAENKPFLSTSENRRPRPLLLDLSRNLAMHPGDRPSAGAAGYRGRHVGPNCTVDKGEHDSASRQSSHRFVAKPVRSH